MRNANLTGSATTRPMTHTSAVSAALSQLRFGVSFCCWALVVSLCGQVLIWGAASFTSLRWDVAGAGGEESDVPLVVVGAAAEDEVRSAFDPVPAPEQARPVGPQRVKSTFDPAFATAAGIATGISAISAMALLPLMGLGVLLAAASATDGVEKTVSAFGWAMVVIVIVLSFGGVLTMPWADEANWTYAALVGQVDAAAGTTGTVSPSSSVGINIAARYLALPFACVVGLLVVLGRFRAGVLAGLAPRENLHLDSSLESETANIKAGSLHEGRAGAAMQHAIGGEPQLGSGMSGRSGHGHDNGGGLPTPAASPVPAAPAAPMAPMESGPSIRGVPQGDAPKRLI